MLNKIEIVLSILLRDFFHSKYGVTFTALISDTRYNFLIHMFADSSFTS